MPTDNSDWLLFLSLERDFVATFDYVPIHASHYRVYSIAYLKTLLVACSSIEQLGKEFCNGLGVTLPKKPNIYEVREGIISKNERFADAWCYMPRFSSLGRFLPWANNAWPEKGSPSWWQANNDSKHNASECATQRSVIDCLAALFCLNVDYYRDKMRGFDPKPTLYFNDKVRMTYVGS